MSRRGGPGWIPAGILVACLGSASARAQAIRYERYALANGLRVILAPDSSIPVVGVALAYGVGGRQESPGRSGFAHLFEHLMFQGSRHAPKGEFDRLLESYGGDNNAVSQKDYTLYYEEIPSNALPVALWLEADRLGGLQVTREALRNQIDVVKEEKRLRIDNVPYGPLLSDEIPGRVYVNWQNAHSTMGSFQDLESASLQDVQEFFDAYYVASNAVLGLAGDFDPARAKAWIAGYFGALRSSHRPRVPDASESGADGFRRVKLRDAHAELPAVAMVWRRMPRRGAFPDYYALTLLGRLLFEGKSSRAYRSLVKDSQAAVSVEGWLGFPESDFSDYKAPGVFGCFLVLKGGHAAREARSLMERALSDVATSGVPGAELARVKTRFRSDWLRNRETALGRAILLSRSALLDGDPEEANASLDRFLAVEPEHIRSAAVQYLKPGRLTLFEVSPARRKGSR